MDRSKNGGSDAHDRNEWTVTSIRDSNGERSEQSVHFGPEIAVNAAYLTLEGMLIQDCKHQPQEGRVVFEKNVVKDGRGNVMSEDDQEWIPEVRHHECNQKVDLDKNTGDVELTWDANL